MIRNNYQTSKDIDYIDYQKMIHQNPRQGLTSRVYSRCTTGALTQLAMPSRLPMIFSRSRYESEYRRYQRKQRRMITSSKCRPRNSAGSLYSACNQSCRVMRLRRRSHLAPPNTVAGLQKQVRRQLFVMILHGPQIQRQSCDFVYLRDGGSVSRQIHRLDIPAAGVTGFDADVREFRRGVDG